VVPILSIIKNGVGVNCLMVVCFFFVNAINIVFFREWD
jgi:hypothetical protein